MEGVIPNAGVKDKRYTILWKRKSGKHQWKYSNAFVERSAACMAPMALLPGEAEKIQLCEIRSEQNTCILPLKAHPISTKPTIAVIVGVRCRNSSGFLEQLLDELHATMEQHTFEEERPRLVHLVDFSMFYYIAGEVTFLLWLESWPSDFWSLAAHVSIEAYVKANVEANSRRITEPYSRPLLFYAIDNAPDIEGRRVPFTCIVGNLLQKYTGPDQSFDGLTVRHLASAHACCQCKDYSSP